MYKNSLLVCLAGLLLLAGCVTNQGSQSDQVRATQLTVGRVQKEIRLGMSGAEVAQTLGSPNIVSSDENRNEVWVYDKMSTEISQRSNGAGVWLLLFYAGNHKAHNSTAQNTLTIIIKFDKNKQVRDFSYHSSRF